MTSAITSAFMNIITRVLLCSLSLVPLMRSTQLLVVQYTTYSELDYTQENKCKYAAITMHMRS